MAEHTLSLNPSESATEARLEQATLLILAQIRNRTALFHETPLEPWAQGLTQAATRWRHHLPIADRMVWAQLIAVEAAWDAFSRGVSPKTLTNQAIQYGVAHPGDRRPLIQLFQVDALLDKWALMKQGRDLFAADQTRHAVVVWAAERSLRQMIHEAVGHTAKELAKNGLALPEATAELTVAVFMHKMDTLWTPIALGSVPAQED